MDIIAKITQTIEPSLEAMGYGLVLIKLGDGGRRKTLTVMAERADGEAMSFDDCVEISRAVSALLDVEDPIHSAYDLEVCSPGLDRPLTRPADFTRYAGQDARLETLFPIDGRKRFKGTLKGIEKETIMMTTPEGEVRIPLAQLRAGKLLASEAIAAAPPKRNKKK